MVEVDQLFKLWTDRAGVGAWRLGACHEGLGASDAVAVDELMDPGLRDSVALSGCPDAPAFEEHRVDDHLGQDHAHTPTWECPLCLDTCRPLSRELTHRWGCTVGGAL